MGELAPGYKPTVIGEQELDAEYRADLHLAVFMGVEISTDSSELCFQARQANAEADCSGTSLSFCYVVDKPLPFSGVDGGPLQPTSVIHPGEIYASPDLQQFYFQGKNKLGTLVSMAYGIRSLNAIQNGQLGLHSALIYDRSTEEGTLLIGRNRVGKSTIGQALEEDCDDRFVMLADDWSEVDLSTGLILPISPIFSPEQPSARYMPAFKSYGKPFYRKDIRDLNIASSVGLARIVEIHHSEGLNSDEFILRALSHIPLIRQPLDDRLFVDGQANQNSVRDEIATRQHAIQDGYKALTEQYRTSVVVNDHEVNSLRDAITQVKRIME